MGRLPGAMRAPFQILLALLLVGLGAILLVEEQGVVGHEDADRLKALLLVVVGLYSFGQALPAMRRADAFFAYRQRAYLTVGLLLVGGGVLWVAASLGWIRQGILGPLLVVILGIWILVRQVRPRR
jgi:hypothetical protein